MNRLCCFTLGLFLFGLVNVPKEWAEQGRSMAVATVSIAWRAVAPKEKKQGLFVQPQIDLLQEWAAEEKKIEQLLCQEGLFGVRGKNAERQKQLLKERYTAMPAQVIFRDPSSWSSSLWIALGEKDNEALGRVLIAENSPVLSKGSVIGVVEYVGSASARIRLISDAGLVPAVRALRGGTQNRELHEQVQGLLERLQVRADLFSSSDEQERFLELLGALQERIDPLAKEEWLAKGEIQGCSAPLWRSRGYFLKGVGFNYDYADDEGPARDLRTGRILGHAGGASSPLLREGDLLITSGLDGVFPAGLPVAFVTRIDPLKDGSYCYELEARPTAGDLYDLQSVWVLPPLGSESF